MQTHDTIDRLMAPVSEQQPAGEDLSYSALFDEIAEARRSDDPDLDQGEWAQALKTADWRKVVKLCSQGLQDSGKDLQLLAWYAEARTKLDGYAGAAESLALLNAWLARYWESGYPPFDAQELDERVSKVEWCLQHMAQAMRESALVAPAHGGFSWFDWKMTRELINTGLKDPDERQRQIEAGKLSDEVFDKGIQHSGASWFQDLRQNLQACWNTGQQLDELLMTRFGDDCPSMVEFWQCLNELRDVIDRILQQQFAVAPMAEAADEPQPDAEAGAEEDANGQAQAVAETAALLQAAMAVPGLSPATPALPVGLAPAAHASPPISSAPSPLQTGGVLRSREEAVHMLRIVAQYFRRNEPHSPVAMLAERAARWAEMGLEEWLAHVIKDEPTLLQLQELLDVRPRVHEGD